MNLDIYGNPDSYGTQFKQFGGGVPVWIRKPDGFRIAGGMLVSTFWRDEVIHAGSPVFYDEKAHTAKILKCFKVTSTEVSGANTIIKLANNITSPQLNIGMNLMVCPSTLSGTGKSVTITSVNTSTDNYYSITVPTSSIDAVSVGSYLVEANGNGAGQSMYCAPNVLLVDDLVIKEKNTVSIPKKTPCSIYENTMPDVPDVVLNNIKTYNPMIEFESYNEI